ncbi:MAG: polyprenyl synthetase family protein [Ruminococcaceae bacterium]|nr:polyprenyl synthetase family protein [Oscillospiraceae bacterium]
MKACADRVEAALAAYIPTQTVKYSVIYDAMRYSLMAGGKRLRPFLTLEFAALSAMEQGDDPAAAEEAALPYACAVEMIHTYSLIHDDLPCMDNDDLRRGKPTSHKVFGEANALLAGDALLTMAFGTAAANPHAPASANAQAAALLSECAGADGMIGGQILDLIGETETYDLPTLETLQAKKTGELIRCASLLGCIAGGGSERMREAAVNYAMGIGRAFQVIDDILDVVGDEAVLGKPIGSDRDSGKTTFVTHMGIESAREYAAKLTQAAKAAVSDLDGAEILCGLADYLLTREH